MRTDETLSPASLLPLIRRLWDASAAKLRSIADSRDPAAGAPVVTVNGRYRPREWTDWTAGFLHGAALLQFDATDQREFLDLGLQRTLADMPLHLTHTGVHDHGFNIVSSYGNLWRLMREGRVEAPADRLRAVELALRVSGAVQAMRWTPIPGGGFIHSFNGPHSLFVDTLRSLRSLAIAHSLGHTLLGENDVRVSLLDRLAAHASATAAHNVYYGDGRDAYDVPGRVAQECVFNVKNGLFRGPAAQQGFSPFTTWTRGLAWAILGFAEQLEFLHSLPPDAGPAEPDAPRLAAIMTRAAVATADFYIANTALDGVPYWDTGAPGLSNLADWRLQPANPFNDWEPVDSSAAAIAAQGLLRLGRFLAARAESRPPRRFLQAGLTILHTLLREPYLSTDPAHQGLLLHAVYHRPRGWDHVPPGRRVPCGEASMWGDYHLREAALYVQRLAANQPDLVFFAHERT